MSGFVTEPLQSDETATAVTSEYGNPANFHQELDSSSNTNTTAASAVTMNKPRRPAAEADISAGQKMLSAVSGSLLTSLLGIPSLVQVNHSTTDQTPSNPPRCRPRPPPIPTILDLHQTLHPPHILHQSSTQPRRDSLLPRSLLGQ